MLFRLPLLSFRLLSGRRLFRSLRVRSGCPVSVDLCRGDALPVPGFRPSVPFQPSGVGTQGGWKLQGRGQWLPSAWVRLPVEVVFRGSAGSSTQNMEEIQSYGPVYRVVRRPESRAHSVAPRWPTFRLPTALARWYERCPSGILIRRSLLSASAPLLLRYVGVPMAGWRGRRIGHRGWGGS